MATLYITEFYATGDGPNGVVSPAQQPPVAEQTVAIGGSSVQSNPLNVATRFVRLHCDAICSVAFGLNPAATATTMRMSLGQTEYFAVPRNFPIKIAVITNT